MKSGCFSERWSQGAHLTSAKALVGLTHRLLAGHHERASEDHGLTQRSAHADQHLQPVFAGDGRGRGPLRISGAAGLNGALSRYCWFFFNHSLIDSSYGTHGPGRSNTQTLFQHSTFLNTLMNFS